MIRCLESTAVEPDRYIIEDLETDGPFGRLMMLRALTSYYFDSAGKSHGIADIYAAAIKRLGKDGYIVEVKGMITDPSSGSYGSHTVGILVEVRKK